jgi:hypothetical protein
LARHPNPSTRTQCRCPSIYSRFWARLRRGKSASKKHLQNIKIIFFLNPKLFFHFRNYYPKQKLDKKIPTAQNSRNIPRKETPGTAVPHIRSEKPGKDARKRNLKKYCNPTSKKNSQKKKTFTKVKFFSRKNRDKKM